MYCQNLSLARWIRKERGTMAPKEVQVYTPAWKLQLPGLVVGLPSHSYFIEKKFTVVPEGRLATVTGWDLGPKIGPMTAPVAGPATIRMTQPNTGRPRNFLPRLVLRGNERIIPSIKSSLPALFRLSLSFGQSCP